jgi:hypothetical protein
MERCPYAIGFGVTLHTRCAYEAGHQGNHQGRGLQEFPYQTIEWIPGDRREYTTELDHDYAWARA